MPKNKFIGWLTRQRIPSSELKFRDLRHETRWLLAFAVGYIFVSVVIGLAIRAFPMPLWGATDFLQDVWYVFAFKLFFLLTLPLIIYRRWGYRFADLGYGWRLSPKSAIVLILSFAIGFFINAGRLNEIATGWQTHPSLEALARTAIGVVLAFLMAGIPEEVVYRGLLQTRLEAKWGRLPAILVSVFLFVAWHIPTRYFLAHSVEGEAGDLGSVLLGTGVPVAVVALIFAWAWDRWRNLPALIAIHAGVDTIPIICSMLQSTAEQYR